MMLLGPNPIPPGTDKEGDSKSATVRSPSSQKGVDTLITASDKDMDADIPPLQHVFYGSELSGRDTGTRGG